MQLLLIIGFLLTVVALTLNPGIGAAVAAVAFIGWSRENALRTGILARLRQAGVELEIAGARSDALEAKLDTAIIFAVEVTPRDDLGDPLTETVH